MISLLTQIELICMSLLLLRQPLLVHYAPF